MTAGDDINPIELSKSIIPVNIKIKPYRDESQLYYCRVTPEIILYRVNFFNMLHLFSCECVEFYDPGFRSE